MAISLFRPTRTVLLIGDESLNIYSVGSRSTKWVDSVPWQLPGFEETAAGLIKKECGGKPILIVNDMTDQHFKGGQRLPKVSVMDRKNVLERKLMVAFPNHQIRGALPIKVEKGAGAGGEAPKSKASGMYLYAAVPMSEQVLKTVEVVRLSQASIAGFCLLPIEAADMVKAFSERLAGKKDKPKRWTIFLGQHRDGSLRQVITRDGQLAMTRMTPIVNDENESERWAREVNQEINATISYLSRFGFTPEDGTDIVTICTPDRGEHLERLIEIPCRYTALTASEASRELGIKIGLQENPGCAEPLHVAWIGSKLRAALPLTVPALEKIYRPRQAAALAIVALLLGSAFLGYQVYNDMTVTAQIKNDLNLQKRRLVQANQDYEKEVARMKEVGFDVLLVRGAIQSYAELEKTSMPVLEIIDDVNKALGDSLNLDAYRVDYVPPKKKEDNYGYSLPSEQADAGSIEMFIQLKFPPTIEPAAGVREVNNLQKRLQSIFSGYDVIIEKNVAGLEYSDTFSGASGTTVRDVAKEEYIAELRIEGPLND